MKIFKKIVAIASVLVLIVCAILGVQKGLFNEFFKQLKNENKIELENMEIATLNSEQIQTATNSETGPNATRMETFDKSFFYNFGDDIYFNYPPSNNQVKGEVMVNVKSASISNTLNTTTLEYLAKPDYIIENKNKYDNTYIVSVEVQFTNVGTAQISWLMANCSIVTFDKSGQVNTNQQWVLVRTSGIISGDGELSNGVIYIQPGESALCKWTCLIDKDAIDKVNERNEQIYFTPSDMYFRSWSPSKGPGKIGFVELNLEVK